MAGKHVYSLFAGGISRSSEVGGSLNPFSFHPFANIGSAVLKLHPIRFATHEKAHYVAID
jgi:hypothetical protein